jgi:ABC-2 type transport system ATP-binding protein
MFGEQPPSYAVQDRSRRRKQIARGKAGQWSPEWTSFSGLALGAGAGRPVMLLRTEDLTKDYGSVRALDRLTFCVAPGEIFGLLGPNGSGKTTALRLLLGFLRPSAGRAWIGSYDCWTQGVAARRLVAYLPGELRLYENMTGWQLVRFLGELRGSWSASRAAQLARTFDLDLSQPVARLSSGMKRKLALLQVLSIGAPLLVLDEPTNTLDPEMREALLEELRRARAAGQAILFSSHVLSEVEKVCDRVGILQRGRLVHVQDLSALHDHRLVRVRFAAPPAAPPELPGLNFCQQSDSELLLDYCGPLPPLLSWLAQQPLTELTITPLGLGAIYRRYQGSAE